MSLHTLGIMAQQALLAVAGEAELSDIEFVGGKVVQNSLIASPVDFTGLSGGLASSPSVGDFYLLVFTGPIVSNAPVFSSPPAGLRGRALSHFLGPVNNNFITIDCGYYESGSASGFTYNAEANTPALHILVYRGVATDSPFDVKFPILFGEQNSNSPDPPSITPLTDKTRIVAVGSSIRTNFSSFVSPVNMTERTAATNNNTASNIADYTWETADGTFDPATFTGSGTTLNGYGIASTFALRPAGSDTIIEPEVSVINTLVVRDLEPSNRVSQISCYVVRDLEFTNRVTVNNVYVVWEEI